jgi:tetratricopeptide (TPR) repeat protein
LQPAIRDVSFEFFRKINVQQKIMKKYSALTLIMAMALCASQFVHAQASKDAKETAKYSKEGFEATQNKDWDKAVDAFRKATQLDRKQAPNLASALQQRGAAYLEQKQFPEAIDDFSEALKLKPNDASIYERRAYVEMKINDYDKALADYSEAIKLKPNEVKYYLLRSYIYETKGDVKNSMADTEKSLKLDPNNQEAKSRKTRLEARESANPPLPSPPPAASPKTSPAAAGRP